MLEQLLLLLLWSAVGNGLENTNTCLSIEKPFYWRHKKEWRHNMAHLESSVLGVGQQTRNLAVARVKYLLYLT